MHFERVPHFYDRGHKSNPNAPREYITLILLKVEIGSSEILKKRKQTENEKKIQLYTEKGEND